MLKIELVLFNIIITMSESDSDNNFSEWGLYMSFQDGKYDKFMKNCTNFNAKISNKVTIRQNFQKILANNKNDLFNTNRVRFDSTLYGSWITLATIYYKYNKPRQIGGAFYIASIITSIRFIGQVKESYLINKQESMLELMDQVLDTV